MAHVMHFYVKTRTYCGANDEIYILWQNPTKRGMDMYFTCKLTKKEKLR